VFKHPRIGATHTSHMGYGIDCFPFILEMNQIAGEKCVDEMARRGILLREQEDRRGSFLIISLPLSPEPNQAGSLGDWKSWLMISWTSSMTPRAVGMRLWLPCA
jgi:hypothetical protein